MFLSPTLTDYRLARQRNYHIKRILLPSSLQYFPTKYFNIVSRGGILFWPTYHFVEIIFSDPESRLAVIHGLFTGPDPSPHLCFLFSTLVLG